MSKSTIYLVTGANRGIGLALVEHLLQRPDTTVIAAFRASSATAASPLSAIEPPPNASNTLIPLPLPTVPIPSPSALASFLPPSITRLDVVVANAGGTSGFRDVASTSAEGMRYDFEANAVGPAELFRCAWPLLERAGGGKFVLVSSTVGSIGNLAEENMPATAYGMSKAAANWWARKVSLDFAERGLAVGILHPGWVKTGMGQGLADALGIEEVGPRMTAADSAKALLVQIDNLTLANSGEFKSYDGTQLPW